MLKRALDCCNGPGDVCENRGELLTLFLDILFLYVAIGLVEFIFDLLNFSSRLACYALISALLKVG